MMWGYIITTTIEYAIRGLADREIVDVVATGIDKALGKGSSNLVFKTFECVYGLKLTPTSIRNGECDVLLHRVIGDTGYHYIVRSVSEEIGAIRETDHNESA